MDELTLIELDDSYLPQMEELYREAFGGEPWNDDWSDAKQLSEYMKDISKSYHALNYGLMMDGKLVGMSVGKISHWWEGTNYNIEELCVSPTCQGQGIGSRFLELIEQRVREKGLAGIFLQTDNDKPSYRFYHKNGFKDLDMHISLYKSVRTVVETAEEKAQKNRDMRSVAEDQCTPVQRITRIEGILDQAASMLDDLEKRIEAYEKYQSEIRVLEEYYASQEWKDDYETDERGEFPQDLKRGVLSQDGIYELLERNREMLERVREKEEGGVE